MSKINVDFSGVEDNGGVAVGNHTAKVVSVTKEPGQGEFPYLKWDLVITSNISKGLHINHITSLKPSALFNLRNTLTALGVTVPKSAITFDPDALRGKSLGIEVFLKESEGKEYSNIKKVFPVGATTTKATAKAVEPDNDIDIDVVMDLDDEIEL